MEKTEQGMLVGVLAACANWKCIRKSYTARDFAAVQAWLDQTGLMVGRVLYMSKGVGMSDAHRTCVSILDHPELELNVWGGAGNYPYISLDHSSMNRRAMIKWAGDKLHSDWLGYLVGQGLQGHVRNYRRKP